MTEGFAALALHRPSRPENIGGALRAADVYGVELVVLGGGELPPEALGHATDTTQAWRRIPVVFADEVLDVVPDECAPIAVERVAEATPLPEFEHPERAMYVFGPENGSLDETILERACTSCPFPVTSARTWRPRSTWCSTTAPRSGGREYAMRFHPPTGCCVGCAAATVRPRERLAMTTWLSEADTATLICTVLDGACSMHAFSLGRRHHPYHIRTINSHCKVSWIAHRNAVDRAAETRVRPVTNC